MNYHFDRLDDETFQQVLLRCRASDFPSLDRVSHRFQTTIRSETFIRLRIATEWAEARAVVWSAERKLEEMHRLGSTTVDESDFNDIGYKEEYGNALLSNDIDLIVDEQIAGNANFYLVDRPFDGCHWVR